VCIKCSGAHRKMGTTISQIKSVTLDTLQPAHVRVLRAVGNEKGTLYDRYEMKDLSNFFIVLACNTLCV
jgi:hypothetical protein